jgi:hypothetical protein
MLRCTPRFRNGSINCLADHRAGAAAKPHIADIALEDWRDRDGPILLKKSIFPNVQNFPEALVRSSGNYMGGHMSSPISNRQAS